MTEKDLSVLNKLIACQYIGDYGDYNKEEICNWISEGHYETTSILKHGFFNTSYVRVGSGMTTSLKLMFVPNDRWRKLKEFGNIDDFNKWESKEIQRKAQNKLIKDRIIREQVQFQKLNNEFIKKQSELIDNQKSTNDSVVSTNTHLKSSNDFLKSVFVWTLLVSVGGLVVSAFNLVREYKKDNTEVKLQESNSKLQARTSENNTLKTQYILAEKKIDSLGLVVDSLLHKP